MFDKQKIAELYPEAEDLMISPMLVWKLPPEKKDMLSDICSQGEYFLQEKIDGAFYQFVKTTNHEYLFGRTVSKVTGLLTEKITNVPHIREALSCLPAGTILIGEIYVPGGTAKDTVHIMGCLPQEAVKRQEKEGLIKYYIHDIIAYDGINLANCGAEERYTILAAVWKNMGLDNYDFLRLAKNIYENQEEEISRILKAGGEGVVLKRRDAPYVGGKRPAWYTIKCKQMDAIDLVCVGLCEPTRIYTGKELETWPYWEIGHPTFYDCFEEDHCFGGISWDKKVIGDFYNLSQRNPLPKYGIKPNDNETYYLPITKPYFLGWKTAIEIGAYDDNGELVKLGTVSSGLTDEDKKEMTYLPERWIGKVVALDCMSIDNKEHTLRHPVFKCRRDDKDAKDCLISEVFS